MFKFKEIATGLIAHLEIHEHPNQSVFWLCTGYEGMDLRPLGIDFAEYKQAFDAVCTYWLKSGKFELVEANV